MLEPQSFGSSCLLAFSSQALPFVQDSMMFGQASPVAHLEKLFLEDKRSSLHFFLVAYLFFSFVCHADRKRKQREALTRHNVFYLCRAVITLSNNLLPVACRSFNSNYVSIYYCNRREIVISTVP